MSAHTPEPWELMALVPTEAGRKANRWITSANAPRHKRTVALVHRLDEYVALKHDAEGEANAHRIVSCVNALAGVPDPAAYVKAFEEMVVAINATVADMEADGKPYPHCYEGLYTALKSAVHASPEPAFARQLRASVAMLGEGKKE
jgi:hypothetical protein